MLIDVHHPHFDCVLTSDSTGGQLVAEHLITRGHRHFGFLGEAQTSYTYVSPSQRRLTGYHAALTEAGFSLADNDVRLVEHRVELAFAAGKEWLSMENRPTAIFASSDILAAGILKAAHELGLAVPDDVAVIGFDDGELAEALDLTTVHQPLYESGRVAMERLLQQLDKPSTAREVTLRLELILRRTS